MKTRMTNHEKGNSHYISDTLYGGTRINEAKQAVERKDKQARVKLANLLEQAAQMLKDEEETE